jgi:hypothetical protein
MNVRFEYLYRDAGNFKNWGEVVFANPRNISAGRVAAIAEKSLRIDNLYFVASELNVPNLHFSERNEKLDHDWHEVHAFQATDDAPNDPQGRNFEEFIELLQRASRGA